MPKDALRIYLTDHTKLWRMYTLWVNQKDGSFYYKMPSLHLLKGNPTHKTSYHPSGHTHFRAENSRGPLVVKKWPNYSDLSIVPIDSFGFDATDFLNHDPILRCAEVQKVQPTSMVLDITQHVRFFQLRIWLGKTAHMSDWDRMKDLIIETRDGLFMAAQFYRFGEIIPRLEDGTKLRDVDLSCAVALVHLESL